MTLNILVRHLVATIGSSQATLDGKVEETPDIIIEAGSDPVQAFRAGMERLKRDPSVYFYAVGKDLHTNSPVRLYYCLDNVNMKPGELIAAVAPIEEGAIAQNNGYARLKYSVHVAAVGQLKNRTYSSYNPFNLVHHIASQVGKALFSRK